LETEKITDRSKIGPSDQNNEAINSASRKRYLELVKLLLEDPRVTRPMSDYKMILMHFHGSCKISLHEEMVMFYAIEPIKIPASVPACSMAILDQLYASL
jgi:hypothetical protein